MESQQPSQPPEKRNCSKCGSRMSPEFVSTGEIQGTASDVRRYICDDCGHQELIGNINE